MLTTNPSQYEIVAPDPGFNTFDVNFSEDIDSASFDGSDIVIIETTTNVPVDPADITVSGDRRD